METKFLNWKHDFEIGNKKTYIGNNEFRLETKFIDWKQWFEIGNTNRWLETCFHLMFPMYISHVCFQSTYNLWVIWYDHIFPISKDCFQCPFLFLIYFLCFQSAFFCFKSHNDVSNVLFCFQSYFHVSNLFLCFQSRLFQMYVSNLHISVRLSEKWRRGSTASGSYRHLIRLEVKKNWKACEKPFLDFYIRFRYPVTRRR